MAELPPPPDALASAVSLADLAALAAGATLAPWDDTTFYGDDARGYNDYARMTADRATAAG